MGGEEDDNSQKEKKDDGKPTILCTVGEWTLSQNSRLRGRYTSHSHLNKSLQRHPALRDQKIQPMFVNESCTSRICYHCGSYRTQLHIKGKPFPNHAINRCVGVGTGCPHAGIWMPRDFNSANAISLIGKRCAELMLNEAECPTLLEREKFLEREKR